jgi:murein L,D-transpeptidase YcbB/YkuD
MNRAGWTPVQEDSNFIQVNIPAFMLYVYEGSAKAFDMPVVVGKEGTNTTMFTGNLDQIVFSPYWNVPESIVRGEIMQSIKKDPNYLKKKNMEIVSQKDSIPKIRQLPGGDNSLGKAKFLFPNSYDIYFHDTPDKGAFKTQKRAYSHGCIRLEDAAKMAQYLLRNNSEWNQEKIQQAMNANKEQSVKLDKKVPVVITYYTAWVDETGQLNFREDIYGHDKNAAPKMFTGTKTI